MTTGKAICRTIIWLILNTLFGLMQYLILLGGNFLNFGDFTPKDTIAEGVVTFFCASLMASTSIDLAMSSPPYPEMVKYFLYTLPLLVFINVVVVYTQLHFNPRSYHYNWHNLAINQTVIIGIAFVYCVWIKFLIFMEEQP